MTRAELCDLVRRKSNTELTDEQMNDCVNRLLARFAEIDRAFAAEARDWEQWVIDHCAAVIAAREEETKP